MHSNVDEEEMAKLALLLVLLHLMVMFSGKPETAVHSFA